MESWGWRIIFLIGVVIVPFGLYIRNRLPETLHAADDAALAPDAARGTLTTRANVAPYISIIVFGLIMLTTSTIGAYVLTYMTTYALNTLHFSASVAIGATIVTSGVAVLVQPVSGMLSDRFGRKPVIVSGYLMTMILVLPVFWAVNHFPSVLIFYGGMTFITATFAIGAPPVIVALTEALPMNIRSGAVATIYAFAISIFGGTTQFVIDGLIRVTHNPLAPAWYWMGAMVIGTLAALTMRETAPAARQ
jgi:MHS family citrate/tricarballylate:H+ symporter-like MFS transporter